ncbi:Protein RCC2 [Porphyridium purpureum]|uniref:Protein RCC2 n=1 Tax=Porphyridium purpureum TaxID=35688 RepID=A0A5J4Z113_PORPP|nr:Protein RCC2 [Porphyridium purpureum]|eukprot:POR2425..scf208_2
MATLVFCGSKGFDRNSTDESDQLIAPHVLRFAGLDEEWSAAFSGPCASHAVLLNKQGEAFGIGHNESSQLGSLVDSAKPDGGGTQLVPVKMELPGVYKTEKIIKASCGKAHTLLLTESQHVFACGLHEKGQLGLGKLNGTQLFSPLKRVEMPEKVVALAAGSEFSAFVGESGTLYTCGWSVYGQLGHDVACGQHHTLVLDENEKVWSFGFGGYGRLGHKQPNDEMRPKLIEGFAKPMFKLSMISAGLTCSYAAQSSNKTLFFWGKAKQGGEVTTYPKPIYDLQQWTIHSIGVSYTSTVIAADNSVISFGPSPAFGELGYGAGKSKSSTTPQKMESMDGMMTKQVAVGSAFTFLVVRNENEADAASISKLPVHELTNAGAKKSAGTEEAAPKRKAAAKAAPAKKKGRK